jgi:anti-sigma B factor antagonist
MNIVIDKAGNVTILELPGRSLDASNAATFKEAMLNVIQPEARLIIDMGNIDFVDSTGLGALVSCLRKARGEQAEIKLCRLNKQVRSLFELVRMHRVFEIFDSVEDTLASYGA